MKNSLAAKTRKRYKEHWDSLSSELRYEIRELVKSSVAETLAETQLFEPDSFQSIVEQHINSHLMPVKYQLPALYDYCFRILDSILYEKLVSHPDFTEALPEYELPTKLDELSDLAKQVMNIRASDNELTRKDIRIARVVVVRGERFFKDDGRLMIFSTDGNEYARLIYFFTHFWTIGSSTLDFVTKFYYMGVAAEIFRDGLFSPEVECQHRETVLRDDVEKCIGHGKRFITEHYRCMSEIHDKTNQFIKRIRLESEQVQQALV